MQRPLDDGWNWPWLLYIGRRHLRLSEEEFWSMTPRKFSALAGAHAEYLKLMTVGSPEQQTKTGYIDQIPGW